MLSYNTTTFGNVSKVVYFYITDGV